MTQLSGLFAALPTPLREDSGVDLDMFDRLVDFVVAAGVDGICIGGATGEYPHVEVADRRATIERAATRLPANAHLLVGIGASSISRVLELGRVAAGCGARVVLLPMPMFYRYEQDDLREYCATVARQLAAPCLLYDLPEFTNPLALETAIALLDAERFIVGIKDSSGRAERLVAFASAAGRSDRTLLVGDDRLLLRGLQAGWNGGVSGVAACCPELLVSLVRAVRENRPDDAARLQGRVDEVISHLAPLPTPWGIRIVLSARGIDTGPLPLPLSADRRRQAEELRSWAAEEFGGA
jgi:dihydrodipicolinate synthase/N-acetylneuraminate lyase